MRTLAKLHFGNSLISKTALKHPSGTLQYITDIFKQFGIPLGFGFWVLGSISSLFNTVLMAKVFWRFPPTFKHIEVSMPLANRKLAKKGSLARFANELMLYSPPSPPDPPIPQKPRAIALGIRRERTRRILRSLAPYRLDPVNLS